MRPAFFLQVTHEQRVTFQGECTVDQLAIFFSRFPPPFSGRGGAELVVGLGTAADPAQLAAAIGIHD